MNKVKYQKLDPIAHIHQRPDMYIGSLKARHQTKEWIVKDDRILESDIVYSDGLSRIFIEALSNAIDNVWRSRQNNIKPTKIKVRIDSSTFETSVWNDGLHIPIEIHEEEKIYNPELIFGHLHSGSNLDDTELRLSSGRNGLGIKLVNVFSKQFKVEIGDPINKKLYRQVWKNNMRDAGASIIKSFTNKMGYTFIQWIPDFEKFGCDGYDQAILALYEKYCIDAAMITKIPVYFEHGTEKKFLFKHFTDYAQLYLPSSDERLSFSISENEDERDYETQIIIASNPWREYREIGYINGIHTKDGGAHLDAVSTELWKQLLPRFNKNKANITAKDLKPFFMIFVNGWAPNPEFNSQSKTKLLSPSFQFKLDNRHVNTIMKWGFVRTIHEIIRSKDLLSLKKTEKKQRGFKKIEGLDHANLAGTKHSRSCTLILCEGLSAKTYAVKGINVGWNGKKGRDYFGIYALRGKLLNVRNANIKTISSNREITDIIQAVGLRYDADYQQSDALEKLQYGRILILTDADEDGIHISALIINLFHKLFPSLLLRAEPFLWYMMTPIAKISYPRKNECFYNDYDYQNALEGLKDQKIKIKYYKGLGTSSDAEINETFGQKVVGFIKDDDADTIIDKVFNKMLSQDRKHWLADFNPNRYIVPENHYNISDYINQDLIKFSMEDCKRSIPNLFDGLKISQRKILYSVFKKKLHCDGKSMKVAQLAGFCAETSNYHHGEQCLYDTITKMAQDFSGSNNVPYLEKDGQFGSKTFGGKDAANARYIFTKCAPLTRLLFPECDDHLLSYTLDDGERVEPDYYVPILPTILGNGCTAGIGTGWSCSVPCFNFELIAERILLWMNDPEKVQFDLVPFYNHFKGKIERLDDNKFLTTGILETLPSKKNARLYEITELPIFTWTNKYKEELESMVESKKLKSLKNYSTADSVHFVIEPSDDFIPTLENMKLKSIINTTNMVLFTENHKLQKFMNIKHIFQLFCEKRLSLYQKRKIHLLEELNNTLVIDRNKKRFIAEVDNGTLHIFRVKEKQILQSLVERKYDTNAHFVATEDISEEKRMHRGYQYLMQIPMRDLTHEKMDELEAKIKMLEKKIAALERTTEKEMWKEDIDRFLIAYRKMYQHP